IVHVQPALSLVRLDARGRGRQLRADGSRYDREEDPRPRGGPSDRCARDSEPVLDRWRTVAPGRGGRPSDQTPAGGLRPLNRNGRGDRPLDLRRARPRGTGVGPGAVCDGRQVPGIRDGREQGLREPRAPSTSPDTGGLSSSRVFCLSCGTKRSSTPRTSGSARTGPRWTSCSRTPPRGCSASSRISTRSKRSERSKSASKRTTSRPFSFGGSPNSCISTRRSVSSSPRSMCRWMGPRCAVVHAWARHRELSPEDQVDLLLRLAGIDRRDPAIVGLVSEALGGAILVRPPNFFPHVRETLDALRARGFAIGLISNTGRSWGRYLTKLQQAVGIGPQFDVRVYSDELRTRKPDPRMFAAALTGLRLMADEV